MSWMSMSQENGQALANSLAEGRPKVGMRVTVVEGRKHKGKVGEIVWHGVDQFRGRQYGSPFQQSCANIMGTHGFRVGVRADDGEKFFVPATYVREIK
jgi:hypothetical protein